MVSSEETELENGSTDNQRDELRSSEDQNAGASRLNQGNGIRKTEETVLRDSTSAVDGSVVRQQQRDEPCTLATTAPPLGNKTTADNVRFQAALHPRSNCATSCGMEDMLTVSRACGVRGLQVSDCPLTSALSVSTVSPLQVASLGAFPSLLERAESRLHRDASNGTEIDRRARQRCYASALGRAGSTGSIDVRSGSSSPFLASASNAASGRALSRLLAGRTRTGTGVLERSSLIPDLEMNALQWLQALDLKELGFYRADEQSRPILCWNVSCLGSDDGQSGAHLGKIKGRELAILVRCLCSPLVSVRVGKVEREGRMLQPSTVRGFLSLTMASNSDMWLSFIGDNGVVERVAVISAGAETTHVVLEEISADASGRTFILKLPGVRFVYFWQSERLKSVGDGLLTKMKNILKLQPSLSQLTGVDDSQMDSFVSCITSALCARSPERSFQLPVSLSVSLMSDNLPGTGAQVRNFPPPPASSTLINRPMQGITLNGRSPLHHTSKTPIFTGEALATAIGNLHPEVLESRLTSAVSGVSSPPPSEGQKQRLLDSARGIFGASSSPSSVCKRYGNTGLPNIVNTKRVRGRSWSSSTESSSSGSEKLLSSGLTAGFCASVHQELHGLGQDNFDRKPEVVVTCGYMDLPVTSVSHSAFPLSPFVGTSVPRIGAFLPPVTSFVPIPTSSLLSPHYCPCPMGSSGRSRFKSSYLPSSADERGPIPTATPFFSIGPSSPLLPPVSLCSYELGWSPVQLPGSSVTTASFPIHPPGIPLFCTEPLSPIPVLCMPNHAYVVRTSSAVHVSGIPTPVPLFCTQPLTPIPVFCVPNQSYPARTPCPGRGSRFPTPVPGSFEQSFPSHLKSRDELQAGGNSPNLSTGMVQSSSAWEARSPGSLPQNNFIYNSVNVDTPTFETVHSFGMPSQGREEISPRRTSTLHANGMLGDQGLPRVMGIPSPDMGCGLYRKRSTLDEVLRPSCGRPQLDIAQGLSISAALGPEWISRSIEMRSGSGDECQQIPHRSGPCLATGLDLGGLLARIPCESLDDLLHSAVEDLIARKLTGCAEIMKDGDGRK